MRARPWALALLALMTALPQVAAANELTPEGWTFLGLAFAVGAFAVVALLVPRMHLKDLQESRTASTTVLIISGFAYITSLLVPWSGSYAKGALLWAYRFPPVAPGEPDTSILYSQTPDFASQYLNWFALPMWLVAGALTVLAGFRLLSETPERALTPARLAAMIAPAAMIFFLLGIDLDGDLAFGAGLVLALVCILATAVVGLAAKERPPRKAPEEEEPAKPAFEDPAPEDTSESGAGKS